jgi:hypothetical protein
VVSSVGLLKPPARVRPGTLLRARDGCALRARAEEDLFRDAEVLTEGRLGDGGFFGSTLVTIDLERLSPRYSGPMGEAERTRLFDAASGSVRVRLRAMRLACADAVRRHPDRAFGTARVETRMRLDGARLLIDVDLDMPLDTSMRLGRAGR